MGDRGAAVGHAELLVERLQVAADRLVTDEEGLGDLARRQAVTDAFEDLALPAGESPGQPRPEVVLTQTGAAEGDPAGEGAGDDGFSGGQALQGIRGLNDRCGVEQEPEIARAQGLEDERLVASVGQGQVVAPGELVDQARRACGSGRTPRGRQRPDRRSPRAVRRSPPRGWRRPPARRNRWWTRARAARARRKAWTETYPPRGSGRRRVRPPGGGRGWRSPSRRGSRCPGRRRPCRRSQPASRRRRSRRPARRRRPR